MLGVMWLTVHFLGNEGRGEIAIFTANLTLVILLNGFIGSSVIVYLTPRTNFYKLLIPAYVWAAFSSLLAPLFLQNFFSFLADYYHLDIKNLSLQNTAYYYLLVVCSFLGSMFEYNYMVLLGKQRIRTASYLNFLRNFVLLLLLIYFFYFSGFGGDVYGFFLAMIITYFIGTAYSFVFIAQQKDSIFDLGGFWTSVREIIKLGFVDQLSNVLQFLNKRIPMYALILLYGKGPTGVLSVAITLAESFLFLTQSISTVQYSEIANSTDHNFNTNITQKLFRLSLVALASAMLAITLVPEQFYIFMFKIQFAEVKELIGLLSVGIISFGTANILNHYFSGIGKFAENVYSNLLALTVTIFVGCYYLIPTYGMWGAAIVPSISNLVLVSYLMISFKIKTKSSFKAFLPKRADAIDFLSLVRVLFKKRI